jgi:hypothetical protein
MKPTVSIRAALSDPQLLGTTLEGPSWAAWRIMLIAAMGEKLTSRERGLFYKLTHRRREPGQRVEEAAFVVGRRGGKSRALATLATYIAGLCDHRDVLAPGETGVCLCIAPDQKQAGIVLDFASAAFESSPILRQSVINRTADTLELRDNITIEVRAASFRRLRGPTYLAVISDEAAYWLTDEWSSNPDVEILNAVRPGLATTGGPLIIASSPYARRGVLWETYRKHFGSRGDKLILVAQGATRRFNPSLPQSVVDRAYARDAASASAEYGATFRTDIEAFVALEIVEACVGDHVELPPAPNLQYVGFCDPSGGSNDAFTLAIAHAEGEHVIIDAIRETRPPFSPESVVADYTALLRSYSIRTVVGDRYAGEWPREQFRKRKIEYRLADKVKSDLYRDALPLLNARHILLPKSQRLTNQLVGLERRARRGGRDSIDHAPNSHDDIANAVCGVADLIAHARKGEPPRYGVWGGPLRTAEEIAALGSAEREAKRNCADWVDPRTGKIIPGSTPCTLDFAKLEAERTKNLVEGVTRRIGTTTRIW